MNKSSYYLDLVREKLDIKSDYALARRWNVNRVVISNFRTGFRSLSDEIVFIVAKELEISPLEILTDLRAEKAKSEEKVSFWKNAYKEVTGRDILLPVFTVFAATSLLGSGVYDMTSVVRCILC
jgi:plasmid maintenance system antidote protein VapI